MKHILLPTDFSKCAWSAIEYALHLFWDTECTFYFLNTYTPPFYRVDYVIGGPGYSAIPDIRVDYSLSGLEKTIAKVKKKYSNTKHGYMAISEFNTLTDEVGEICRKRPIDMIVMGTKGASGVKEIFLGSNTVHIIRKAKVPVIAVPEEHRHTGVQKIAIATDYHSTYAYDDLKPLFSIADKEKTRFKVIHALGKDGLTEEQKANKTHLKEILKDHDVGFEHIEEDDVPNMIHRYVEANDIDLLAMMNHKHSFLERLMVKQNIDAVGFHTTIPFLVLRDSNR